MPKQHIEGEEVTAPCHEPFCFLAEGHLGDHNWGGLPKNRGLVTVPKNVIDYAILREMIEMNERIRQGFEDLYKAVSESTGDYNTKEPSSVNQQTVDSLRKAQAQQAHERAVAEVRSASNQALGIGGGSPMRAMQPPPQPHTSSTLTVWEALERTEKAREGLHSIINELEARLEGVVTPAESVPTSAMQSPGGFGVAYRENSNAQSIEEACYHIRGIISRLSI